MRVMHTSDWHLGANLFGQSRLEDHAHFLDWLLSSLDEHRPDVLVVAGDVFDQAHPVAEAQRLYFDFLARVLGHVRHVVVVGGNHDSPSRLDAPRSLLAGLGVHVVGGLLADESTWSRCVCPIRGAGGAVEGVVLAVPFVHECRLGVRTAGLDEGAIRASFKERFTAFYRDLTERALETAAGAPVVASGHLACVGATREDAPYEIHMAGATGGLPPEIFDERLGYVALGHFHRGFRVGDRPAWYSGTPIALNPTESRTPRQVLLADLTGDSPAVVKSVRVPPLRDVLHVRAAFDDVVERLRAMTWDTPRPPLVVVEVEVPSMVPGLEVRLGEAVGGPDRPALASVRQVPSGPAVTVSDGAPPPSLRDLSPEDVFRRLCAVRGEVLDDDLLAAFREVASPVADEVLA